MRRHPTNICASCVRSCSYLRAAAVLVFASGILHVCIDGSTSCLLHPHVLLGLTLFDSDDVERQSLSRRRVVRTLFPQITGALSSTVSSQRRLLHVSRLLAAMGSRMSFVQRLRSTSTRRKLTQLPSVRPRISARRLGLRRSSFRSVPVRCKLVVILQTGTFPVARVSLTLQELLSETKLPLLFFVGLRLSGFNPSSTDESYIAQMTKDVEYVPLARHCGGKSYQGFPELVQFTRSSTASPEFD